MQRRKLLRYGAAGAGVLGLTLFVGWWRVNGPGAPEPKGQRPLPLSAIEFRLGAVALMNERLPHEHFKTGREGPDAASLRRVWLFIIAITLHNFPEGLAVGVGVRG